MAISLVLQDSKQAESKAYIISKNQKELSFEELNEKESLFLKQSLDNEKSFISINQYDRCVYFVIVNSDKGTARAQDNLRRAGHDLCTSLNDLKLGSIHIINQSELENASSFLAEGTALSNYQYLTYKSDKKENSLAEISIEEGEINPQGILNLNAIIKGTFVCRDLVNDHNGHLTSEQISLDINELSKKHGFSFEYYEKAKIEALKMGGLLAVNRASNFQPTFNIMEWKPENAVNTKPIVLIGKGVVYDTGGLSLKPTPNSMDFMKCDMAGAGAVIGTMCSVSEAKLPVHVIALVAATDNHLNEKAYGPGEVITMMSGKTVEVLNTDAEGRLTLADALHYAKRYEPQLVFDMATLTGAAARAIGVDGIVYMGNADKGIKEEMEDCGHDVHERLVEFPLWDEFDDQLKSDIADLKNLGGAEGGAITAGKFLEHFTDYPWLHFDIAAPAYLHHPDSYRGKNATGVGVRLFFNYLQKLSNEG